MPLDSDANIGVNACDLVFGLSDEIKKFKEKHPAVNHPLNEGQHFLTSIAKVELAIKNRGRKFQTQPDEGFVRNKEAIEHISMHKKYNNAVNNDVSSPRRKCKGILDFQIFGKGLPVHFVLDEMDTKLAARKINKHTGERENPDKQNDVTNAELRWVFRNREMPEVRRNVQFWLKNQPCFPPWVRGDEETKLAWQRYDDEIKNKRKATNE